MTWHTVKMSKFELYLKLVNYYTSGFVFFFFAEMLHNLTMLFLSGNHTVIRNLNSEFIAHLMSHHMNSWICKHCLLG